MKPTTTPLFARACEEEIMTVIRQAVEASGESPFWAEKILPFSGAILSALIPLQQQGLLFTPEGRPQNDLTPELFFRWCDLVSLKSLAFTLQKSNEAGRLVRTKHDENSANAYEGIELERLGTYLSGYGVNLEDESADFPIAHYNLHQGVTTVLKGLL